MPSAEMFKKAAVFMNRKSELFIAIFLVIILALSCAAYFLMAGPYWNISSDSYTYFKAGESIFGMGQYQVDGKPLTVVPFLFPGMLSAVFLIFGKSYFFANLFIKCLTGACVILAFLILRQRKLPTAYCLFLTILFALNTSLIYESTSISADIPFTFLSFLSIYFFTAYTQRKNNYLLVVAVIFIILSYFTKTVGIALVVASLIYLFFEYLNSAGDERNQKKRMLLTASACFVIPIVLWEIRNAILPGRSFHYIRAFLEKVPWVPEYATPMEILQRTVMNFVPSKLLPFGSLFINGFGSSLRLSFLYMLILAVLYIIMILAIIIDLKRNRSFLSIYLLLYIFIFSVMNMYGGGTRYLIPILPFIFYYIFNFMKNWLIVFKFQTIKTRLFNIILTIFLLFYGARAYYEIKFQIYDNQKPLFAGSLIKYKYNPDEQEIALWLKAKEEEKIIICMAERYDIDGLVSGRIFYEVPYTEKQEVMLNIIRENDISYVIMDKKSPRMKRFLSPAIKKNPGVFKLIIDKKEASLYQVERMSL